MPDSHVRYACQALVMGPKWLADAQQFVLHADVF